MAKNKKAPSGPAATNLGDHAGPDVDQENLERLARSSQAAAGAAVETNGGEPPDEVVERNFRAIEVALAEIDAAGRIMQKARAELSAVEKTAKTDLGSKGWVMSIKEAVKLKRQADKGGTGELVTEHRQIGRALRLLGVPLGTQFHLFAEPPEEVRAEVTVKDQELAGYHAFRNKEPRDNNEWQPGTANHVSWDTGWLKGEKDAIEEIGRGPTH